MKRAYVSLALSMLCAITLPLIPATSWSESSKEDQRLIQRGRYLAQTAGCNDCHTPGYAMSNGNVPETQWLIGDNFGWRGPWGTTYPPNLRLFVQKLSEAEWIKTAHTLKTRPPMPWFNLNAMHNNDLRALYRFIVSLGDPGQPAPAYLPPGQEPNTAYAQFPTPPVPQ